MSRFSHAMRMRVGLVLAFASSTLPLFTLEYEGRSASAAHAQKSERHLQKTCCAQRCESHTTPLREPLSRRVAGACKARARNSRRWPAWLRRLCTACHILQGFGLETVTLPIGSETESSLIGGTTTLTLLSGSARAPKPGRLSHEIHVCSPKAYPRSFFFRTLPLLSAPSNDTVSGCKAKVSDAGHDARTCLAGGSKRGPLDGHGIDVSAERSAYFRVVVPSRRPN